MRMNIAFVWTSLWILATPCLSAAVWGQYDPVKMQALNPQMPPAMSIDHEQVEAAGIRQITGRYLELYTDLDNTTEVEDWVVMFDAAVPQWCQLFDVNERRLAPWRMTGFLMQNPDRFRQAGLLPASLPDFPAGYNRGHHFWVITQPGNYYTRHLILHEGTHAFMQWFLGGSGPAWYSEGMAEKIGLHRWDKGELQLGFRPQTSDEVDYWGRPRLIALAVQDKRLPRLDQVFDLDAIRFTDVENYAWSWAACEFLSTHPLTTEPFERAKKQASISTPAFSLKLKRPLREKWPVIERDWKLFIDELGYGSTAERSAITPAVITAEEFGWRASVDSSHSWQATGVTLPAGDTIEVKATGQYQIADQTRPVVSEANGVTLHYYRGRPWGELTAALLLPDGSLTPPLSVGNRRQLTFDTDGELLLRINETPREMGDNQGELSVELRLIPKRD